MQLEYKETTVSRYSPGLTGKIKRDAVIVVDPVNIRYAARQRANSAILQCPLSAVPFPC
jgi:hypothetical protein